MRLRRHQAASASTSGPGAAASPRASSRSTARMSKNISEASAKRSVDGDQRKALVADREHLAVLGADVDVAGRLARGGVGGGEQGPGRPSPGLELARLAASAGPVLGEDRAAAQVGRHLDQAGDRELGVGDRRGVCGAWV